MSKQINRERAGAVMMKTLSELGLTAQGGREATITGLSVDSRQTMDRHLFAALPGVRAHGAEYVQNALRMGAKAILTDPEGVRVAAQAIKDYDPALVVVEDPRQALGRHAAALWFGRTARGAWSPSPAPMAKPPWPPSPARFGRTLGRAR